MTRTLRRPARHRSGLRVGNPNAALFPLRSERSFIQWPSEQEIRKVTQRLARIQRVGIRLEAAGDYFSSGDLAYQIQEILRATEDLIKKTQRIKR